MDDVLDRLSAILAARKQADPASSYVAGLHKKGLNKILEKVGEEATETILAAKDAERSGDTEALVQEDFVTKPVFGNGINQRSMM